MGGRLTAAALGAAALAWLAGIALQLQQRELGTLAAHGAWAGVAAIGVMAALRSRWATLGLTLAVFAAAFACTDLRASMRLAEELPASLEGRDIVVTGVIAALPQRSGSGQRFRFEVEQAALPGVPELLALGWYDNAHEDAAARQPIAELRAGERWRFTVRLRRPHGNLNPGGFDYELALFEQGVRATGYVRDAPAQRLDATAAHPVERLRDAIDAAVPDRRAAGVLAALSVGDQGAIERDDWELFRNTGVAHLMSISGLHVTMFAWLAGLAVGALWRRSARLMLRLPAPFAARWGGFAAALAYAVFSGWGVPSQRTVWMLAAVVLLQSLGLRWPWPFVLLAAGVVVTVVDPWAMLQAGFWLSFVAVGVLMANEPAQRDAAVDAGVGTGPQSARWARWARAIARSAAGGLRTQIVATLALTPLSLVFFQQVSVVGLLANLVAIPLVTLVITPLALLGALIVPLWTIGALTVQGLCAFLGLLAALPGAVWTAPTAPPWAQAAGLAGAVLLVRPLPWRLRRMAIPLLLPLLFPAPLRPPPGDFELIALDVGQGTAVLVRTREHLLVYDAGPQYSRDGDAGRRVLLPLLRARGERRIDRLVLSHRDTDHVGGAAALFANLEVGDLFSSLAPDHPLVARAARHEPCRAGQGWTWDGVRFELLHPTPADVERAVKPNAVSCVLRVSSPRGSALLTGDIEREQELGLVDRFGESLRSDVLIVPHHGSRTSSIAEFLDRVRPAQAVFQAGYRSRFGHPAPDVLARYRGRRIEVLASPSCGAWTWSAASPQGVCERDRMRRYWQRRFEPEAVETAAPQRCEWPDTC